MLPESRRSAGTAGSSKLTWSLNQPRVRSIVYQALLAAAVGFAAWYFVFNAMENLMARRIASGFGFLSREAGFEIGEITLLSYNAGDTYLRALAVGLFNTFRVATLAIIFSTILGALIGWRGYRTTGWSRSLPQGISKGFATCLWSYNCFFGTP
jgi:general L-amino acid transport system permease protein